MDFEQQVEEIGYYECINIILVNAGIRNAFLLQYVDYGEFSSMGPTSTKKLSAISNYYPRLKFTEHEQGMLISRKRIPYIMDCKSLGQVLDYPCASVYEILDTNQTTYSYHIYITCKIKGKDLSAAIMSNASPLAEYRDEFENLANKYKNALLKNPLTAPYLVDVFVKEQVHVTTESLFDKLTIDCELEEDDINQIDDVLYNASYKKITYESFDIKNPIHKGILLSILAHQLHNPMEAFYPLTGSKNTDFNLTISKQEYLILQLLDATK